MDKVLDRLIDGGVDFGLRLIGFLLILIIGFKIVNIIIKLLKKGRGFSKLEKSVQSFIISFVNQYEREYYKMQGNNSIINSKDVK